MSNCGCVIGAQFLGCIMYADDFVLLVCWYVRVDLLAWICTIWNHIFIIPVSIVLFIVLRTLMMNLLYCIWFQPTANLRPTCYILLTTCWSFCHSTT